MQALELNPYCIQAKINLGNVYYKMRKYAKSIHMYKSALEQNRKDSYIYANLGSSYLQLNNLEESLKMLLIAYTLSKEKSQSYSIYLKSIIEKVQKNLVQKEESK
ncbi:MAG: tetratricopeptide repeat protein [Desulfobacterales bacterium]|nr:tetratricopeptide repeat protein [Desulfobacterales bacterium]